MAATLQHHHLPPGREHATLLVPGAVQFTPILDFMIMLPLGSRLMSAFNSTPHVASHAKRDYGAPPPSPAIAAA